MYPSIRTFFYSMQFLSESYIQQKKTKLKKRVVFVIVFKWNERREKKKAWGTRTFDFVLCFFISVSSSCWVNGTRFFFVMIFIFDRLIYLTLNFSSHLTAWHLFYFVFFLYIYICRCCVSCINTFDSIGTRYGRHTL